MSAIVATALRVCKPFAHVWLRLSQKSYISQYLNAIGGLMQRRMKIIATIAVSIVTRVNRIVLW